MRAALVLGVGATFTALLLVIPALHAAAWSGVAVSSTLTVLIALPMLVLLATLMRPMPALTMFAFPCAHLPALLHQPELTGKIIYGGKGGVVALAAVAAVGAAWFAVASWAQPGDADWARRTRKQRVGTLDLESAHQLPVFAIVSALAIYGAFAAAALESPKIDPLAANISLLVGLAAVWYGSGRLIAGRFGDVLLERRARRRLLGSLFRERRRNPAELWLRGALVLIALIAAILWYSL